MNESVSISLEEFIDDLDSLSKGVMQDIEKAWYQVGAAHLARTKANTPVGVYSREVDFTTRSGQHVHFTVKNVPLGGQLRLRWQQEPVSKDGGRLITIVYNNSEYAPYVEYGHRIRNKSGETIGFVPGRFMMTKSLQQVFEDAKIAIAAVLDKWGGNK